MLYPKRVITNRLIQRLMCIYIYIQERKKKEKKTVLYITSVDWLVLRGTDEMGGGRGGGGL